ncbi:Leng9 [Symbiodinium sp. CCMP2456]|nr:Leng9 [Symbiodinium sp. CCMP2456]
MAGATVSLDAHSALAILPPDELLTEVQAVRQQNDKAYVRWPQAHLRVLWPFLPVRTALPRLEQLNEKLLAFPVELSEVRLLNGLARAPADRAYVGVTPSDATRRWLLDLVERLLEDFPECRGAESEDPDFHVTLGQFPLHEAEHVVATHCVPLPLTWHCGALAFCARANSEEPFRLVQSIPLRPFYPPARKTIMPHLPSHAWCTVIEAVPVGDAARLTRLLQRQGIAWKEEWWHKLIEEYFNVESLQLQQLPELSFCSLAAAATVAASLRWAAVSRSKAAPIFECRVVREFQANSSVRQEDLAMPFQTASCVRHSDSRLLAVGESSSKDSGLAIWNLASLNEKPRFCKLRGHIQSIDVWQDTLLVLGKGGSLALHDLSDPRATPTSLFGRKADGAARDAHWMAGGRLVAAFAQKVRVIDLEADGGRQSCDIALSCPVIAPLDADHVALSGPSSCVIWDFRKSASAMEVPWPSSFSCTALAASGASGLLIGGRGAQSSPVHTLDLRMPTAREAILPIPGHELRADKVLAGSSCFFAQFDDGSLAHWHAQSHSALGWWPNSQCVSQPTAEHQTWHGLAAAGAGRLRVATPCMKATLQRGHAKKEVKATLPVPTASHQPGQGSKLRLRTSEDVYHRLIHDERFRAAKVIMGYEDRFLGPLEVQLLDFRPGGDIPYHRVYYFREEEHVLWDRRARLDRVFGTGEAVSQAAAAETKEAICRAKQTMMKIDKGIIKVRWSQTQDRKAKAGEEEIQVMKYSAEAETWLPLPGAATAVALTELRVLTFNVLFELFGDVETHMEARLVQIFRELSRCGADIMALQEVTPQFAEALLSQPWVREQCWSSAGANSIASVEPSGQLILSRVPMESAFLARISPHKTVILASFPVLLGESRAVTVANLHLPADSHQNQRQPSRRRERQEQLRICENLLLERSGPTDLTLLLGDFNSAPEVEPAQFRTTFADVWLEANPDMPGHTFDPTQNAVARRVVMAVGGSPEPRRLDRIYVHSDSGPWQCHAELTLTRSFPVEVGGRQRGALERWFASDHFAVLCSLRPSATKKTVPEDPGCILVRAPMSQIPCELLGALTLHDRPRLEVVLLGSSALGIADKACSAELTSSQYFAMARQELEGLEVQDLELAEDAVVPLLKFRAEGKEFEVQFSELRDEHLPLLRSSHAGGCEHGYETLQSLLFQHGSVPQVGLSAALDAWILLRAAFAAGREEAVEAFRTLAKEVKLWARQRQLLGTAFGFPGGFAWALLVVMEVVRWFSEPEDGRQSDLATRFYQRLSLWEWPAEGAHLQQKVLSPAAQAQELPVLWCPAGPKDRNALRSLTRGTAGILQAQLRRAALEGAETAGSAVDLPEFLILSLVEATEDARSRLQRKALSVLLEAERCAGQATVWPLTEIHTTVRDAPCIVLGCSGWAPTYGEQLALVSSLRISQGIELEAKLVSASSLREEVRSKLPDRTQPARGTGGA